MNLNCLIVDDEPNAVKLLEALVQQSTGWTLVGKCYNALEALAFIKEKKVDFIFLDINMPDLSGIELAGLLPIDIKIVFTTAYGEYGVDSYSYQTIDYLLKPITLRRFLEAVQKIETFFAKPGVGSGEGAGAPGYFFVKSGKEVHKIVLDDILYFEGEKEYVRLVTGSSNLLIYRRLKDITDQLPAPFVRVHNSYIVNTSKLLKIIDNHIHISGKKIPVSEKFRNEFMSMINMRKF